jgi:transcriptional regulator with XRE-family HTH domain
MQPPIRLKLRTFGEAIRHRRIDLGESQEGFAELCGLHRTYVGQIERGEKNVSFENILRISSALGVNASELFIDANL